MLFRGNLRGNPYLFLGRRPFREARLRSYLITQHRLGRPLADVLRDPYVQRCGSKSFCWSVLLDPETIAGLEHNLHTASLERPEPGRGVEKQRNTIFRESQA